MPLKPYYIYCPGVQQIFDIGHQPELLSVHDKFFVIWACFQIHSESFTFQRVCLTVADVTRLHKFTKSLTNLPREIFCHVEITTKTFIT